MIVNVYGVFDEVSNRWFLPLKYEYGDKGALRSFAFEINNNDFLLSTAKDYALYYLGCFDDELGILSGNDFDGNPCKRLVARGDSVVQSDKD